jgi:hypothetical protein
MRAAGLPVLKEDAIEKLVDKQNPERNRDLLTRVIDEEQRNQIKHLTGKEEAQDAPALGRDETYVRTNGAIRSGVIWA